MVAKGTRVQVERVTYPDVCVTFYKETLKPSFPTTGVPKFAL